MAGEKYLADANIAHMCEYTFFADKVHSILSLVNYQRQLQPPTLALLLSSAALPNSNGFSSNLTSDVTTILYAILNHAINVPHPQPPS